MSRRSESSLNSLCVLAPIHPSIHLEYSHIRPLPATRSTPNAKSSPPSPNVGCG
jgi:hypothetical protein